MAALHNRVNGEELKRRLQESNEARVTISFYKYHKITDAQQFRDLLFRAWSKIGVLGRIYVAQEGINAQISVPADGLEIFKTAINSIDFLNGVRLNVAVEDDGKSFFKLAIKVREKIVADGLNDDTFDASDCGTHLNPEQFNTLTDDPNTILVDMRNHYESEVGFFEGATRPDVETFRESLPIIEEMLRGNEDKNLVMYCTGGIRCEKASAYFKHKGFENVFQLDGGIIQYAQKVKESGERNKFKGVNFVFDERLGERISEDVVAACHLCGAPCDTHKNCANDPCHILFIQCESCGQKYNECCSDQCADFITLPEAEQLERRKTEIFNGTKFGKTRFKKEK
jgi:UPF0176 protein